MLNNENSHACTTWSTLRNWFVPYGCVAALFLLCLGCGPAEPPQPACPTVVPGFDTFACNQSRLSGLVLGTDDLFWTRESTEQVANDQADIMRLSTAGGEPIVFAANRTRPWSIVVDSDFVYWLEVDTAAGVARVMKLALTGGEPTVAFPGLSQLRQILVDQGDIYLVVGDSDLGGYGVSRLPSGSSTPQILVENWKDGFFNVMLDGENVFFSTSKGELWRVPKLGGTPSLVTGGMLEPLFMTAYAANIYVTDRSGKAIWGIDESTGTLTKLADAMWLAVEIAADDKNAYWFEYTLNTPPGTPPPSAFRTVPRAGGSVSTIADIAGDDLRGDATHLYFTYETNVLRFKK